MQKKVSYIFFGTPKFSTVVLENLKQKGLLPALVITNEDKPSGRGLVLTAPPVKNWAIENKIDVLQPTTLKDPEFIEIIKKYCFEKNIQIFIVASYGKIIPKELIEIPPHGALNIHPSLLPKLRGPSPIETAILTENETGVTIMLMDEKMDHGPIVATRKVHIENWPPYAVELEKMLAEEGSILLTDIMPDWIEGKIRPIEQNHNLATFSKMLSKENARVDLNDSPEINLKKIRAYSGKINAWTEFENNNKKMRLIIKKARIENGELILERVIPEGKKEVDFEDFKRNI